MRCILILFFAVALAAAPSNPYLWPVPSKYTAGDARLAVPSGPTFFQFKSKTEGPIPPTLSAAFERYEKLTFPHFVTPSRQRLAHEKAKIEGGGSIPSVMVSVDDLDESHPQLGQYICILFLHLSFALTSIVHDASNLLVNNRN